MPGDEQLLPVLKHPAPLNSKVCRPGFRLSDLRFRVWGLRGQGSGFTVEGFGFRAYVLGLRVGYSPTSSNNYAVYDYSQPVVKVSNVHVVV